MADNVSINDFVSHFETDFARPNLFQVGFSGVSFNTSNGLKHLEMSCKGVQIPGVTFIEGSYMLKGRNTKTTIGADFDPINLTFFVDGRSKTLEVFDEWSNKIYNRKEGTFGFKEDYECTIDIFVLDRQGNYTDQISVLNAYPTNIEAVDLNYDTSDAIMELTVAFNFDRYECGFNGKSPDIKQKNDPINPASVIEKYKFQNPFETFENINTSKPDLTIKNLTSLYDDVKDKADLASDMINKVKGLF